MSIKTGQKRVIVSKYYYTVTHVTSFSTQHLLHIVRPHPAWDGLTEYSSSSGSSDSNFRLRYRPDGVVPDGDNRTRTS